MWTRRHWVTVRDVYLKRDVEFERVVPLVERETDERALKGCKKIMWWVFGGCLVGILEGVRLVERGTIGCR